jgi:O-antigen/teichoic acid export membrane protein
VVHAHTDRNGIHVLEVGAKHFGTGGEALNNLLELDTASRLPGRPSRSVFGNVVSGSVGFSVYGACQWLIVVSIARLGSAEMVGTYALAIAIVSPVFILTNLHLAAVQVTDVAHEYRFGHYLALRTVTSIAGLVLVSFIATQLRYPAAVLGVIGLVAIGKWFDALSDIFLNLSQVSERLDFVAVGYIVNGVISLAGVTISMAALHSVAAAAAASAFGSLTALVLVNVPLARRAASAWLRRDGMKPSFDWERLLRLAKLTFPVALVLCLSAVTTSTPRFIIERDWGTAELGVYAAVVNVSLAGTAIVMALGQATTPRLASLYFQNEVRRFWRLIALLVLIAVGFGLTLILGAAVIGSSMLKLLYGPSYAGDAMLLIVVAIASTASYGGSILGYGVTAARYFVPQAPIFAVAFVAGALGCLWFVPHYGALGAAWVTVLTGGIQATGCLGLLLWVVSKSQTRIARNEV